MVDFVGTNGNDRIAGTSKDDFIVSGDGNDLINSGAGDDFVIVGDGNNIVNLGTGNDTIITGNGNNLVAGGDGNDIIIAGAGDDILAGDGGDDIITGGAGADVFQYKANFGNDIITDLNFGEGDYINVYAGTFGNAKNIQIKSQADIDALVASNTITQVVNADGSVTLGFGASGTIKLVGFAPAAKQNVTGNSLDNILLGGASGDVHITGGKGDDVLVSGPTSTLSEGGEGTDVVIGGAAVDKLTGNAGNDVLASGAGNDQINGGLGNDILSGGIGADRFSFTDKLGAFGNDLITDLNFAEGDFLSLDVGGSLTSIKSLGDLNAFVASSGAVVTSDAVSATLTLNANESIRLVGFSAAGGVFN